MSKFPQPIDLAACHCTALRKVARRVSLLYDRHLSPAGLTSGQFAILTQLAAWPGDSSPSLADLAAVLILDRTATTRALQPMVRDGLIQLSGDPNDRRVRLVRLTGAGRKRLAEASGLWAAAQAKYAQAVGERQALALRALAQIIAEAELGP